MPSPYTGTIVPTIGQDSPSPGPGVVPITSLPVDADALNAASTYQPWKSHADFIAYLQSSAKWFPTQTPSAGFTPSIHIGPGTGTVTGDGQSNGGQCCVVKITLSGGLNVGQFEFSLDAGVTYGVSTTIPLSGVYVDASGIAVEFSGTFTLNDLYVFFAMDTPQARWVDSAGNNRTVLDHNGFIMGRSNDFREEWYSNPQVGAGTAYAQVGSTPWSMATSATRPTIGAIFGTSTYPANQLLIVPGTQNGDTALVEAAYARIGLDEDVVTVLELEVALSVVGANGITWSFGFNDDADPTVLNSNGIRIVKTGADTTWQCYVSTGGAHTIHPTVITPVVNVFDRFRIELHGINTAVGQAACESLGAGVAKARFFINETRMVTLGSNLPTSRPCIQFAGSCTAACTSQANVGPVRMVFNRYLSLPSL